MKKTYTFVGLSILACTGLALTSGAGRSNSAEMPSSLAVISLPGQIFIPTGSRAPGPPTPLEIKIPSAPVSTSPTINGHIERSGKSEDNWQELYEKGDALYRAGQYEQAYKVWKLSSQAAEKQKCWTHVSGDEQIEILKKLAMMHKTQNEPALAIDKYDLAITTAIKTFGAESIPVAQLMLDQGRMYAFYEPIKNSAKANEFMNEAFRINEKFYGRYTIPTGDVAIAIAQLKESQNLFAEAIPYWQLAIDIGDKLEPGTISCCRIGPRQGKSRCLEQLGKFDEAIAAYKDVIAMCRQGAASMMPSVLNAYASCLLKAGRDSEAQLASAEALSFKN